jgi:UDP-N-acetylglucosamine 2-epimerase (non-hydrolysing)
LKTLIVFGTRPEAIKMAPLIISMKKYDIEHKVCVSAQHRGMLDQVLDTFNIHPDYDLDIMRAQQSLSDITSLILTKITYVLNEYKPDVVFVHGDTATTFAVSLAAFYHKIDVAHVEAGLRTGDLHSPYPEEANRKLTAVLTKYHFVPTHHARENLLSEKVSCDFISITGNTVIDSLLSVKDKIKRTPSLQKSLKNKFDFLRLESKMVLITGHRRENFGHGFEGICLAIKTLAKNFANVDFVYPVHLNPNVQEPVRRYLSGLNNVHLIEPQDYVPFVYLMMRSYIILTDSGGIQEEAPSLGKPVLVMRNTTERIEALEAGTVRLVGTDTNIIIDEATKLLTNQACYDEMAKALNPYGDGRACERILQFMQEKQLIKASVY